MALPKDLLAIQGELSKNFMQEVNVLADGLAAALFSAPFYSTGTIQQGRQSLQRLEMSQATVDEFAKRLEGMVEYIAAAHFRFVERVTPAIRDDVDPSIENELVGQISDHQVLCSLTPHNRSALCAFWFEEALERQRVATTNTAYRAGKQYIVPPPTPVARRRIAIC